MQWQTFARGVAYLMTTQSVVTSNMRVYAPLHTMHTRTQHEMQDPLNLFYRHRARTKLIVSTEIARRLDMGADTPIEYSLYCIVYAHTDRDNDPKLKWMPGHVTGNAYYRRMTRTRTHGQ